MRADLLIIGSGLSGLFAANLAIDQGLDVQNVSRGRGGLSLSHGCIDMYDSIIRAGIKVAQNLENMSIRQRNIGRHRTTQQCLAGKDPGEKIALLNEQVR